MITLKEWMELADYKITEGSDYGWQCYGPNAYQLDNWNGDQNGYSLCINFDTTTQIVHEVQAHDYGRQRAYRLINPEFKTAHDLEASERGTGPMQAWDNVTYVDLDVDDDFIQKALSIKSGEDYDTRVQVPVEFSDEELLQYMKLAHELDITFNELVENALEEAIEQYRLLNDIHFSNTSNPIDFPPSAMTAKKKKK